jgi:hypothetical protein
MNTKSAVAPLTLACGCGPERGLFDIADVLAALKVRYRVGSSAATYLGECPDS